MKLGGFREFVFKRCYELANIALYSKDADAADKAFDQHQKLQSTISQSGWTSDYIDYVNYIRKTA